MVNVIANKSGYTTWYKMSSNTFFMKKELPKQFYIEGYPIPAQYTKLVEQYELEAHLDSIPDFLLNVSACLEKIDGKEGTLSEFEALDRMLQHILIYHGDYFYRVMMAKKIDMPYRLWVHFSHDCDWYAVCVHTFHDMPEDAMTRYINEELSSRTTISFDEIKEAMMSRKDAWGLPADILQGLIYG